MLSRAFASQAACYVIAVGGVRRFSDTPERYRSLADNEHTGDSYIIDPRGEVIAGPAEGETILVAEGSMEAVLAAKAGCDIAGHYSGPIYSGWSWIDGRPGPFQKLRLTRGLPPQALRRTLDRPKADQHDRPGER